MPTYVKNMYQYIRNLLYVNYQGNNKFQLDGGEITMTLEGSEIVWYGNGDELNRIENVGGALWPGISMYTPFQKIELSCL